jgi:glycosyltransferase involved in cell wall biosynthesis
MPARFWKWRMQGGSVTLAEQSLARALRADAILASDMVNVPAFLALTRPAFSHAPVALYMHENQLTYPTPPGEKRDLTYGMINWLSMLAADRVFFNSRYHLDEWFGELPRLLKHFPEYTHVERIAEVQDRSEVLPVGCDLQRLAVAEDVDHAGDGGPAVILWNQRWEYDKAPETFFRALYALADEGLDYRAILAGKCHRQSAGEFDAARHQLGDRVIHYGYASETDYAALLTQADVVVSTAIHEFFGVAVIEAIHCGCFPVLPRGLSYPEIIPSHHHDRCLYDDFEGLLSRLRWALANPARARRAAGELRLGLARYDWAQVAPRYDAAFESLTGSR